MNLKRVGSAAAVTLFLAACQDASLPTGQDPGSPAMLLSDGRDLVDGNPDFFWFPPMLPNPSGEENFEAGQFDSGLLSQSRVRICAEELDEFGGPVLGEFGEPVFNPDGTCAAPAVAEFTSTLSFDGEFLRLVALEELYQADWHTDMSGLDDGLTYRIFALISDNVAGFADLDVVDSGKELKSVATGEFVALKDGRTLPIKFRLEAGIRCLGLAPDDCGAGVVDPDAGGLVFFAASDGSAVNSETTAGVSVSPLAPHDGSHTDDVVFVVQSCLAATGSANLVVDIPAYGPCIDVTAFIGTVQIFELPVDPGTGVPQPTTIFACITEDDVMGPGFAALKLGQEALLRMHRQDGAAVEALPLAEDPCALIPVLASSPSSGIVRFARAVLDRVAGFIGPKTLHARRRRIDLRSGGVTGRFSQFQLLLPGVENKVIGTDNQIALVGTDVTLQVLVLDGGASPQPVENALVHFEIPAGGGGGSLGSPEALTNGFGIAEVVLTLDVVPGPNSVRAFGFGIADQLDGFPFFDPTNVSATSLETGEEFFTATGVPPDPAVTVDGVMSGGEWDGAIGFTFDANLPEGGTTPAALFFTNDATNLYVALRFGRSVVDPGNSLGIEFDVDGSGSLTEGDDGFVINPSVGAPFLSDNVRTTLPPCPVGVGLCGLKDTQVGGTNDGQGFFLNSGGFTIYEASHPLSSGDAFDFDLSAGDMIGFQAFLRMIGPDAEFPEGFGDTNFPTSGFQVITIQASPSLPVADQVNDPVAVTSFGCGDPPAGLGSVFQSFTPSLSSLARVQLRLRAGGSFPAAGLTSTVNIRSGGPTGAVIGTATAFVAGPQPAGTQILVDYTFASPLTVSAGDVIEWVSLLPVELTWMGTTTDPYSGGNMFGCTGLAILDNDLNFTTFSQ